MQWDVLSGRVSIKNLQHKHSEMKCNSTSSVFLPFRITCDVVSLRSFIDIFVAFFFEKNKDDDSFATILMFLGSTLLSKMRGKS